MEIEEFRRHAHDLVDWMADYMGGVERYPVRSRAKPGEMAARLPEAPPDRPEAMADIMAAMEAQGTTGTMTAEGGQ